MAGDTNGVGGSRPVPLLAGEGVLLRCMERGDLEHVHRWLGDAEIAGFIGQKGTMTRDDVDEWFTRASRETDRHWFTIVLADGDRPIGEAGLLRVDEDWRTADMSVVIGERDAWRQGYGAEVGRLLLEFAFDDLGLHRVAVGVVGFHEPAIRFWKKLGFRYEGVQREGYLLDGQFHDFVMMSVLEDEWRSRAC